MVNSPASLPSLFTPQVHLQFLIHNLSTVTPHHAACPSLSYISLHLSCATTSSLFPSSSSTHLNSQTTFKVSTQSSSASIKPGCRTTTPHPQLTGGNPPPTTVTSQLILILHHTLKIPGPPAPTLTPTTNVAGAATSDVCMLNKLHDTIKTPGILTPTPTGAGMCHLLMLNMLQERHFSSKMRSVISGQLTVVVLLIPILTQILIHHLFRS